MRTHPLHSPFSHLHHFRLSVPVIFLIWTLVVVFLLLGFAWWPERPDLGWLDYLVFALLWLAGGIGIYYETVVAQRQINQLKKVQEKLVSLRHFNELILNHVGEGIVGIDLAGQVTFINPAGAALLDYSPEYLIGKFLHPLIQHTRINGDPLSWEDSSIFGVMQTQKARTLDHEIFWRGNGSCFPVAYIAKPIFEEGQLAGAVVTFQDITDRRKAELALRDSEALFESLVENLPQNIYRKNLQGRFTFANKRFCETIGHPLHEILGKTDFDFYPEELAHKYVEDDDRVILEQEIFNCIEEHRLPDGQRIYVQVAKTPIYDSQGMIVGTQGIFWDVTDTKRANEELQLAKEEAEKANRYKNEFLANISHEIRTPMNAIIGMTELALEQEMSPDLYDNLRIVKEASDSLLRLLNDLLDFSKIESGTLSISPIPFRLRDSLSETLHVLSYRSSQKNLELLCHVVPEVPDMLIGDPGRLRQVLVNLVGNAIKFTEQGEVELEVKLADPCDGTSAALRFTIRDTGIGVPKEKQSLIFESFQQGDCSTSRRYGGVGLGLSISSKLLELMGGEIGLISPLHLHPKDGEGPGSAFFFTLRFPLQETMEDRPLFLDPAVIKNLRVLVVDDNATNRCILKEMLLNWELCPETVVDAESAWTALQAATEAGNPYALLLTDVNLPGLNGFELAEKVKADASLSNLEIMILTSSGFRGDAKRCEQLGIAAYLTKPVKQSELLESILAVVASHLKANPADKSPLVTRYSLHESQHRLSILLAEDNLINQVLATKMLERMGHWVRVANDGQEAVAAFEQEPFDLVLMDIQMPGMDGYTATAKIRQLQKDKPVPIVAMTAHAMKGDREKCLQAGMDDYISKPVKLDALAQVIEKITHLSHTTGSQSDCSERESEMGLDSRFEMIDMEAMLDRVDGDKEIIQEIAKIYIEEAPSMLEKVREAVAQQDPKALEHHAHTLKGVVSNFAAETARRLSLELEEMGRKCDLQTAPAVLAALEDALEKLNPVIQQLSEGSF
ncbi:MAG: response regulator [bacterium]|jgi:PAS domain S-box-containing protein|nr:response regulator [bacterium]